MENYQAIALILTIVGSFGTAALTVNAFFLKGIFSDLNDVKVVLAAMAAKSEAKEKDIEDNAENIKEIFHRLNKLEQRKCE